MENTASPSMRERRTELDLLKFVDVIIMCFIHTYEVNGNNIPYTNGLNYALRFVLEFISGANGAPAFMFIAGLGIVYSRHSEPAQIAKRGLMIFATGIMVNFLEQVLPVFWEQPTLEELIECIPLLFAADVYFYFALVFLFMAFAVKTGRPKLFCVAGIAVSLIYSAFSEPANMVIDEIPLTYITGLFVRTNEYSYFPLMSWLSFALAGYLFGGVLMECPDKDKLYKQCFFIAVPVLIASTAVGALTDTEICFLNALECSEQSYYNPNFLSIIWGMAALFIWIVLAYCVMKPFKDKNLKLISWGSKNLMPLYCMQWLVIAMLNPLLKSTLNLYTTFAFCAVTTLATFGLTWLWLRFKKYRKAAAA